MIWPAALSGAAPRVTRTAVGRRVLQLALLAGGLFVLGLVCGGQAQAADGLPGQQPGIPAVASVVKPVPVRVPVLAPVLAPVSDTVKRVVQPVSDVVEKTVTEVLTTAPAAPTLPTWPSLPTVPSRPVPPVRTSPAQTAPAPVRSAPRPSGGEHADGKDADREKDGADPVSAAPTARAPYGPRLVAEGATAVPRPDAQRGRPAAGPAPAHQAPNGDHDGAPHNQSGVDSGASRHCDAHAVTPDSRVPVRLVPGVAPRADIAETRDRYRDVPVFPG